LIAPAREQSSSKQAFIYLSGTDKDFYTYFYPAVLFISLESKYQLKKGGLTQILWGWTKIKS
jgi:hypothetical protein